MPELKTLPEDIYALFNPDSHHEINEDNLDKFTENLKELIRRRFAEQQERKEGALRFSMMGKPDRRVWMDLHPDKENEEPMLPKTYFKFLYGDVLEELILFLAREAGHDVSDEQREVEVDGVKGHIDAVVDGVVVDVKSASPYGFTKFKEGTVEQDDPFGYVGQLAGYANVITPGEGAAWVAFNKVAGDICVSPLGPVVVKHHSPVDRIAHIKEFMEKTSPPPLCYDPVPDGKSGNMKLPAGCSYCPHKFRCFPHVRKFIYSSGPRYLTDVKKTPLVLEVDPRSNDEEGA